LHHSIATLPNVNRDRVTSLATETYIRGIDGRVEVGSYPELPSESLRRIRWQEMPPHTGTLVSPDERGAIILVELEDQNKAGQTYTAIRELVSAPPPGVTAHIAGYGAVSGYLSRFIDVDSRTLQPLVLIIVCGVLFAAFRTVAAIGARTGARRRRRRRDWPDGLDGRTLFRNHFGVARHSNCDRRCR